MLHLAVCDDSMIYVEQIEIYIKKIKDIKIYYEVFFSAEELYRYKTQQQMDFDAYILDIEMSGMSGLDLAKILRQESPSALIVFLTNHSECVYDVFEVITCNRYKTCRSDQRLNFIYTY